MCQLMISIMGEKNILYKVVKEGLSKEMTFERPKRKKMRLCGFWGRAFLEEGRHVQRPWGQELAWFV